MPVYLVTVGIDVSVGSGATPAACGQDIAATGFLTTYQYDTLDNLTSASQSGLNPRTFTYDSLSRLTSATNPESGKICYGTVSAGVCQANGYDANGNLIAETDARGVKTTFAYDTWDRLTGKTYSDSTPAVTFNYDQTSALGVTLANTKGRKSSESTAGSNATGAVFSYDTMGRLVDNSQCTPLNCGSGVFTFQYPQHDLVGNLLAATNASGVSVNYFYDAAARLTTMTTNFVDGSHPGTLFSNAVYGPIGLTSDTLGNGITESLGYDNRSRLKSFTAASGSNTRYSFSIATFAPNGDILAANDSANGNWTYTYDAFNRIIGSNQNSGQAVYSYDYDRFGNRWHQNGPHSSQLGFDTNNHVVAGSGVTYDVSGNVTADGSHTYTYDAENRISSVDAGTTASYAYDAEGRRSRKTTASAGSVDYLYDLNGHQVAEVGATGVFNRGELYARNRHLATYTAGQSGSTFFTHSDWLGTERARTNMTASTCESIASLPFGDGQTITTTCTDVSPMHFTGKERDPESGLDNFGARFDSSSMGRFMTPDPGNIGVDRRYPQSWNAYSYSVNNPLNLTDPTGLYVCEDSEKCDSPNDKAFAKSLADAQTAANKLTGDDRAAAQRAIDAYGAQGDDNGVNVRFDSNVTGGVTEVSGVANGNKSADLNPNGQNINVTFNPNAVGGDYSGSLVAHEGSHVADGSAWVASGFSAKLNPTNSTTEFNAFHVQFNIINSLGVLIQPPGYTYTGGHLGFENGPLSWKAGDTFKQVTPELQQKMKENYKNLDSPAFRKGGVLQP